MIQLDTIRTILRYSDWANGRAIAAAEPLGDDALDRTFEMGVGSLRRTLIHILNGESVWLARWRQLEPAWPSESEQVSPTEVGRRLAAMYPERDAFLATLRDTDLARVQRYRDSRGSLFDATLGDMLFQACNHSIHHRAQAVNMLRHVGAGLVELDYMVWLRRPTADPSSTPTL